MLKNTSKWGYLFFSFAFGYVRSESFNWVNMCIYTSASFKLSISAKSASPRGLNLLHNSDRKLETASAVLDIRN